LFTKNPSGFLVGLFACIHGRVPGLFDTRILLAAEACALEQYVTRHARGCQEQGKERDEKTYHQPAHRSKLGQGYQTGRLPPRYSGLTEAGLQPLEAGLAVALARRRQLPHPGFRLCFILLRLGYRQPLE
jgi:hypothetical protein